ncbi:hypothetical protein AAHE18_19G120600 [Arachis hypogaea]
MRRRELKPHRQDGGDGSSTLSPPSRLTLDTSPSPLFDRHQGRLHGTATMRGRARSGLSTAVRFPSLPSVQHSEIKGSSFFSVDSSPHSPFGFIFLSQSCVCVAFCWKKGGKVHCLLLGEGSCAR